MLPGPKLIYRCPVGQCFWGKPTADQLAQRQVHQNLQEHHGHAPGCEAPSL